MKPNPKSRSELAVPLVYKGKVIGVIDLEHTRVNYFNEDHQRTLSTLAAQVAVCIANARLYQRIHEEEQRMERDLEMARQVQLRLMPSRPPKLEHAEIAAQFVAARSIGGDVYDFLDYGPGRVALAVGDVSGKAAPAALYAALMSGILRSLAPQHLSPGSFVGRTQRSAAGTKARLAVRHHADCRVGRLATRPYRSPTQAPCSRSLLRSTRPTTRSPSPSAPSRRKDFPLGLFPDAEYEEFTLSTQPGDMIVFFSDGIVDAVNAEGEMFGEERLKQLLESQHHPTAQSTVDAILQAVTDFQAGTAHFDDETIVVLRALEPPDPSH